MSYGTVQAEKMTTESGYSLGAGNASSFKNKFINGGMQIAQRGTSFTGITSGTTNAAFPADRFKCVNEDSVAVYSVSQVADAPPGFVNSAQVQVTTVNATPTSESYIEQVIEGTNCTGLAYGTSAAASVTLSFWIKVSVAGTYNVWMFELPASKSIGSSFTVTSANTWQFVSLTFPGDTASALTSGNGAGIYVRWYLDIQNSAIGPLNSTWTASNTNRMVSGSVRFASTLNATYQITGAQFEVGTVPTSFDYRPYGTELALCQRYFQKTYNQSAVPGSTTTGQTGAIWSSNITGNSYPNIGVWSFAVPMRTSPTVIGYNPNTGAVGGFRADSDNLTNLANSTPGERGVSFFGSNVFVGTHVFVSCHATASAEL